jgi:putative acetyltransferase
MDDLTIALIEVRSADAVLLIARLDEEINHRYGELPVELKTANVLDPRNTFLVAYVQGRPVACGAYRPVGDSTVEVKRMYVEPDFRGRGIARRILAELEGRAVRFGFTVARLETGVQMPEAIRLYESAGYRRIDNYGTYVGNPHSVCFEKSL